MKKSCIGVFVFMVIMFYPMAVKAACSYEKLSKFKLISNNINYDYSFNEKDKSFKIRFTNVDSRLLIQDHVNKKVYYPNNNHEIIVENFSNGKKYEFTVKTNDLLLVNNKITVTVIKNGKYVEQTFILDSADAKCGNTDLSKMYINFPQFNEYYIDPVCKNFEEYKLCQKWYAHNLNYNDFKKEVLKAKEEQTKKNINESKDDEDISFLVSMIEFIKDYYIYIVPTLLVITALIVIKIKKRNKSFEGW